MTQLYSVKKHNRKASIFAIVLSTIALIVATSGLIINFNAANYLASKTKASTLDIGEKLSLARDIEPIISQTLQVDSVLSNTQRHQLLSLHDQATSSLLSMQNMPTLSTIEGKALIKIDLALSAIQSALHQPRDSTQFLDENQMKLIVRIGQQQLSDLVNNVERQGHIIRQEQQNKLYVIMTWSLACLAALSFVLYLLVRYIMLLNRYISTVEYLPAAKHDMEQVFANLPEATLVLDFAGNVLYANKQACQFSNYGENQLAPMHIGQLISEADTSIFELKIKECTANTITDAVVNFLPKERAPVLSKIKIAIRTINNVPLTIVTLTSIAIQQHNIGIYTANESMFCHAETVTNTGSWRWNFVEDDLFWSDQVYKLYGYQPEELDVNNDIILSFIPSEEREAVSDAMNESMVFGKPYDHSHHIIQKDGNRLLVRQQAIVIKDSENKATGMIGCVTVCDKKQQSSSYQHIFINAKNPMVITNKDGIVEQVNPAFSEVTGYASAEVIDKPISSISRGAYFDENIYKKIWNQLIKTNQWEGELWNTKANGLVYPTYQYFTKIDTGDTASEQYLCSFSDISEQKHVSELLSNHSIEQQTKLPSRNVLFDRITHAIKRHERDHKSTVVILLSLNTETTPSQELLKSVSSRLKKITRSHDSIARFGLYEFIIVLEGISHPEDAYIVSDKIAKSFSTPFNCTKIKVELSCNIGIAMHPLHSANDVLLLNYADAAMQYAKANNDTNIQVFNENILKDYNETQHLNNQLQRAIDLKELSVQFQPIMDLSSKAVSIAVAHIRWHHAAYNNTQTYQFIDAAKNGKLRQPLHFWLLNNALEQATQWPNHDLAAIKLQIKVVREQLSKPGLATTVKTLLNLYHYAPTRLILEVEAESITELGEVAQQEIVTLKELGVTFNVSSLDEHSQIPLKQLTDLDIDSLTSAKRALTDTNQGSQYIDISEQLMGTIEANSIYPTSQAWVKNACTINIGLLTASHTQTYLVCDSVPNEKLIILAHLLKSKSTA